MPRKQRWDRRMGDDMSSSSGFVRGARGEGDNSGTTGNGNNQSKAAKVQTNSEVRPGTESAGKGKGKATDKGKGKAADKLTGGSVEQAPVNRGRKTGRDRDASGAQGRDNPADHTGERAGFNPHPDFAAVNLTGNPFGRPLPTLPQRSGGEALGGLRIPSLLPQGASSVSTPSLQDILAFHSSGLIGSQPVRDEGMDDLDRAFARVREAALAQGMSSTTQAVGEMTSELPVSFTNASLLMPHVPAAEAGVSDGTSTELAKRLQGFGGLGGPSSKSVGKRKASEEGTCRIAPIFPPLFSKLTVCTAAKRVKRTGVPYLNLRGFFPQNGQVGFGASDTGYWFHAHMAHPRDCGCEQCETYGYDDEDEENYDEDEEDYDEEDYDEDEDEEMEPGEIVSEPTTIKP